MKKQTGLLVASTTLGLALLTTPFSTASAADEPSPTASPSPESDGAPVVINAAAGQPATMTFTRVASESDSSDASQPEASKQDGEADAAAAADVITCNGTYDYPHPASSSNTTTINAHLTVTCNRPVPLSPANMDYISLQSQMHGGVSSVGAVNYDTQYQRYSLSIGGDLQCFASPLNFYAEGSWTAKAPAGYEPNVQTANLTSLRKKFVRQADGTCKAA